MIKKYIRISILFLIIFSNVFILTGCFANYKNKENVIDLLNKISTYTNYRMEIKYDDFSLTSWQKDNVIYMESNMKDNLTMSLYYNEPNDEIIISDGKYAITSSISKYIEKEDKSELYNIIKKANTTIAEFESDEYEYSYIGKTKVNDEPCIEVSLKNDSEEKIYNISTKTGAIYKVEVYDSNKILKQTYTANFEMNCVTDDDVKKPDLKGFKIFNLDK